MALRIVENCKTLKVQLCRFARLKSPIHRRWFITLVKPKGGRGEHRRMIF